MITLKKDADRDFVVLNLTDPQLADGDWSDDSKNRRILLYTVNELIARVSPDLITVSGDIAYSGHMRSYENFASMLDSYGIPWSFVWGNHDNQGGAEVVERQSELMLGHSLCRFEKGGSRLGNGNYTVAIEENGRIIYALIMMDSHDRMKYPALASAAPDGAAPASAALSNSAPSCAAPDGATSDKWAHLLPEQLDWYKSQVESLGVPTALIMHIPFYAYRDAFDAAWDKRYKPESAAPDENGRWLDRYKDSCGVRYEEISSYPADCGEFSLIKRLGSTDIVLVGHDHVNNFIISYEGVRLAYALKTGAGCYWNERLNGGTVLRISREKRTLEHIFVDIKAYGLNL